MSGASENARRSPDVEFIRVGGSGRIAYVENRMSGECDKCGEHCLDCKCHVGKVYHPVHYKGNRLEAIDVIEDFNLGFCLGNAIKYILRAGKKGEKREDLLKAIWYLQREITEE